MYDKIYVINLDKSTDRLEKIAKQLNDSGLVFERFSAVNGYNININDLGDKSVFTGQDIKDKKLKIDYKHTYQIDCNYSLDYKTIFNYKAKSGITAGELGLWCSNQVIWKMALKEGYSSVIILEDDVKIKNVENFKSKLDNFASYIPETFDVTYIDLPTAHKSKIKGNDYVSRLPKAASTYGSWAVIYSEKAMKKLLDFSLYTNPIDLFLNSKNSLKASAKQFKQDKDWFEIYVSSEDLLDVSGDNSTILEMGR